MMLKTKHILTICGFLLSGSLQGQNFNVSQYDFTPLYYNPGKLATEEDMMLSVNYRNNELIKNVNYVTSIVSFQYPIMKSGGTFNQGGAGISVFDDRVTHYGLFKSTGFSMAYAQSITFTEHSTLSLGLQGTWYQKKLDASDFTTGSQWVDNVGFDPLMGMNEEIIEEETGVFTANAGLFWNYYDDFTNRKSYFGFSLFHLNNPEKGFTDRKDPLELRYVLQAGYQVWANSSLEIMPKVLYINQKGVKYAHLGAAVSCKFEGYNPFVPFNEGRIELYTGYVTTNAISAGCQFHQKFYALGLQYAFNVSQDTRVPGYSNAVEVVFALKFNRGHKKPQPKMITDYTVSQIREFYSKNKEETAPVTSQKTSEKPKTEASQEEPDKTAPSQKETSEEPEVKKILEQESIEIAEPKPDRGATAFQLKKDFKFAFNDAKLDANAKEYLNNLVVIMQENDELLMEVIGHTDDVGTEEANYKISLKRAQIVVDYFISKGLDKNRFKITPKLDKEPLLPNTSPENRSRNRRVEFIIYN